MHTFQPLPIDMLELNPFQKIGKEWMLITAERDGKPNAMTAAWGGLGVLWGKDVAFVFVRESRYTKELLDGSDAFSLSFLNFAKYKGAMKYLGAVSGRDEDKIANARLSVNRSNGTPFIDEADMAILCRKLAAQPLDAEHFTDAGIVPDWYKDGDPHTMYVGEITALLAR